MEPNSDWLIKMQAEVDAVAEMNYPQSGCIHKLPPSVIKVKPDKYKPHTLSLGPYHYGGTNLKAMEEHKHNAVLHFFRRSKRSIGECWVELEKVVDDLKLAYTSLDSRWQEDTEGFLRLMIRDGCFMLEIWRIISPGEPPVDYAPNDPFFGWPGMIYHLDSLRHDILLLQNQLPVLVLHRLLALYNGDDMVKERIDTLVLKVIQELLFFFFPYKEIKFITISDYYCHMLDVYRKDLVYGEPVKAPDVQIPERGHTIALQSARQIQEAGIRIRKSKTRSLSDISFDGGILRLPAIVVTDLTESQLLNLMAFERFQAGIGQEVTSYVFFMARMLDNAGDISFLSSIGIIQNEGVGTDEDIAQLFKLLSKDIIMAGEAPVIRILLSLESYGNRRFNKWRGYVNRTYFRNPWASISLIASIVLFVLTLHKPCTPLANTTSNNAPVDPSEGYLIEYSLISVITKSIWQ